MPPHTSYDVLSEQARPVGCRFELAALRLTASWLDDGRISASAEDLRLATEFLRRCGITVDVLPGLEVRLVSAKGRSTMTTREDVVVTALRHLVALEAERAAAPAAMPNAA